MASFPKPTDAVPVSIGRIRIEIEDVPALDDPFGQARRDFTYKLQLKNAAGAVVRIVDGDLRPYLTPGQVTALNNFLDSMRTKAVEALP